MAESCAARGYEATTVEDVCAAAGVGREAFDREFVDKDECLGAAMESVVEEAWLALEGALAPGKPWGEGLYDGTAALLGSLAKRPAFAHVALIEVTPAVSGRAGALAASARAALLDFLERGQRHAEAGIAASAARGALAGAETLARGHVLSGKAAQLGELTPDVVYMLAVPFLGVGEASLLAAGPRRRHLRAVA
jgi:AcrR family transcriptional regulator